MIALMGITEGRYYRLRKRIKSGLPEFIPHENLRATELRQQGATVLAANSSNCLYIKDNNLWLDLGSGRYTYLLDNDAYAISTVSDLINDGYWIRTDLQVYDKVGRACKRFTNYLVAAYADAPLETVRKVCWRDREGDNRYDIRIDNLRCVAVGAIMPSPCRNAVIQRRGDDIYILYRSGGVVEYVDYSPEMMRILTEFGSLTAGGRDKRLSLQINGGGGIRKLYHIRVALDLYGLPVGFDRDDVVAMMERFRAEYLSRNITVDHIDGNHQNNRLSNLILMSRRHNIQKQKMTSILVNLDANQEVKDAEENADAEQRVRTVKGDIVHWFCWSERFDSVSICMRAGYCSPLQAPVYLIDDILSVKEYLRELERFIEIARDRKHFQFLLDNPDEGENDT